MCRRYTLSRILCCSFWFIAFVANGQVVGNVKASFAEGKVVIMYDLTGGKENQRYAIELYSSHDEFAKPLKLVKGDVGKNIKGGKGKKIVWDAVAELGPYGDEITFRVKFAPVPMSLVFKSPVEGSSLRRGKKTIVQWEGGAANQTVRFELYKNGERIAAFAETKNNGHHTWQVPRDLKKGQYTLRLKIGEETENSGVFFVKPRIPFLLKLSPFIIAGAGVAFWLQGIETSSTNEDLAPAPGPK